MPGKVTSAHFSRLWERQRGVCWICKTSMLSEPGSEYSATIDHIIPRAYGGSSRVENLKLAHAKCNHKRGAPPPPQPAVSNRPRQSDIIAEAYRRHQDALLGAAFA